MVAVDICLKVRPKVHLKEIFPVILFTFYEDRSHLSKLAKEIVVEIRS